MLSEMSAENHLLVVIGYFTAHSHIWWDSYLENDARKSFEPFTVDLGLYQLIAEPTHFMREPRSCIDLILTDKPKLYIDFRGHPSLND